MAGFICFLSTSSLFAERISVFKSLSGLDDLSRFLESDGIDVDLAGLASEEEKALKICEAALRSETTKEEETEEGVVFLLKKIQNKEGVWYADFDWQYKNEFKRKNKLNRFFKVKVDLGKNILIYQSDLDGQPSDGSE